MRKFSVLVLAIIGFAPVIFAQNIKVKKGVVYVDKVEKVLVDGNLSSKVGEESTFKDLTGKKIFTVTNRSSDYRHPEFEDLLWYAFEFPDGEAASVLVEYFPLSNKNFVKWLLELKPSPISGGVLDQETIAEFIKTNDSSPSLAEDTLRAFQKIDLIKKALAATKISRGKEVYSIKLVSEDISKKPKLVRKTSRLKTSENTRIYRIELDNDEIGRVRYDYKRVEASGRSYRSDEVFYFYKRFPEPIELGGEVYDFMMAAYFIPNKYRGFTIVDGKPQVFSIRDGDAKSAVIKLLREGYL